LASTHPDFASLVSLLLRKKEGEGGLAVTTHPDFASLVDPFLLRKKEGEGSYCKSILGLSVSKSVFLQETPVL